MRPNGRGSATIGLSLACVDTIDVVHHAVAIGVKGREVDIILFVDQWHRLLDELVGVGRTVSASIVFGILAYCDWSVNLKLRIVHIVGSVGIEVVHRSASTIVRESFLMEETVIVVDGVVHHVVVGKLGVGKLHQDDEHIVLTRCGYIADAHDALWLCLC